MFSVILSKGSENPQTAEHNRFLRTSISEIAQRAPNRLEERLWHEYDRRQNKGIKVYFVFEDVTPAIYQNTIKALAEGHPFILNYCPSCADVNRQQALGPYRKLLGFKNYQREEYSFASTFQGGKGARVKLVTIQEHKIQTAYIRKFNRELKPGQRYIVIPVAGSKNSCIYVL